MIITTYNIQQNQNNNKEDKNSFNVDIKYNHKECDNDCHILDDGNLIMRNYDDDDNK